MTQSAITEDRLWFTPVSLKIKQKHHLQEQSLDCLHSGTEAIALLKAPGNVCVKQLTVGLRISSDTTQDTQNTQNARLVGGTLASSEFPELLKQTAVL